jgi:hypothetical protein
MRTTPLILLMLLANFLQKKKSKSLIKKTEIKRAFKKKIDPNIDIEHQIKELKLPKTISNWVLKNLKNKNKNKTPLIYENYDTQYNKKKGGYVKGEFAILQNVKSNEDKDLTLIPEFTYGSGTVQLKPYKKYIIVEKCKIYFYFFNYCWKEKQIGELKTNVTLISINSFKENMFQKIIKDEKKEKKEKRNKYKKKKKYKDKSIDL